jgi:hypothetical protein
MYPHRIRLRGPWECEPLARLAGQNLIAEGLPPPTRMTMPARWRDAGLPDFRGRVRLRRRFGYPGRIDAHERVWLTCAGVDGTAEVRLNDAPLGCRQGADGPFEFEVTELLRPRNDLCVEVVELTGAGGLWGEVALEVRCTAYLRHVRAWWATAERAALHVSGELVGSCAGPLELYAVAGRYNLLYAPLTADGGVTPWHRVADDVPPAARTTAKLQVELVQVSVKWYVAEVSIAAANP